MQIKPWDRNGAQDATVAVGRVLWTIEYKLLDWPLVDLRRWLKTDEKRVSRRAKNCELENYCRIVANERIVIPENISNVLEYVTTQMFAYQSQTIVTSVAQCCSLRLR